MIPQTDRRCKPFLAKKRPGREKAHGVSSRPGVRTARPVQTPSGKLSAVVWAAGAGFMQGAENVQGAVLWGAPQGRRRRRRAGAARRSPRSGPPAGRGCGDFMAGPDGAGEGARRAPRPKAGDGGGRRPPPRRRRRRPAGRVVRGKCLGEGRAGAGGAGRGPAGARPQGGPRPGEARPPAPQAPDCGAYPASAERRMVIAGVVRRPPGHGRCRRWPAGFWCAGGGHWGPCPAHRGPLPPHGRPSWKGS